MRKQWKTREADPEGEQRWKFMALSQGQARARTFIDQYILISIQDPEESLIELSQPPNCCGILRLKFDDIDSRRSGMILFSREQAHRILDFVHEHSEEASVIACHCKMGMCRSPGVVGALAVVMNQRTGFLLDTRGRPKYRPNRHVHETLVQEGRGHPLNQT